MTEPTPPPRRPLATFLRAASEPAPEPTPEPAQATAQPTATTEPSAADGVVDRDPDHDSDNAGDTQVIAEDIERTEQDIAPAPVAPSFMRAAAPAAPTPRWQWGLVGGLVALLALQIAVADRARLAADAGSRPWVAGLCSILRCSLPAWQEPTAFSMISRDVRPVVGQPGALQVHASFRNDARWAQAWPSLRLSLSDADGRVIGSSIFTPQDYLAPNADAASLLEPGQSAQIAFRVREPAASTVAFTFEFL